MKDDSIQLSHGGGGRLTREFIEREILTRFGDGPLRTLPDGAIIPWTTSSLVFTTDSFVVSPLEFPGGNIGHLAVHGSVNDIAVSGGRPLWISVALIVEEGFPLPRLRTILDSVKDAATNCGVTVATGDTKVVGRGQCDGLFINTAALGETLAGYSLSPDTIRSGDCVLVSGPVGDHGMAVLALRENIRMENGPSSDSGSVHRLVMATQKSAESIRFMRDPTRGGVATVLNEMVAGREIEIHLRESDVPVSPSTRAVAEMLGLDPLHSACEGRVLAVCAPDTKEEILAAWRAYPEGVGACCIGEVRSGKARVILETSTGGRRIVDMPRGELLPRIC